MNVVVIGGGAAGMISAIVAAKEKNKVIIIEKTSSLGNKLKITGKGRCNLTFSGGIEKLKANIVKNYKFMYSSFSKFNNEDLVKFFNDLGVKTKIERGCRVFPVSDDASEIVNALQKELKNCHVEILLNTRVNDITIKDKKVYEVITDSGKKIKCDKCIVTTGGKSYAKTGSTGDGYAIAKNLGHSIVDIMPGLVPLKSNSKVCKDLQGLSLKNIELKIVDSNKVIYKEFGEIMFAHFGITGPVVLSASSKINRVEDLDKKFNENKIKAIIDLKPALDKEKLDKRICRDFEKYNNKEFKNSLNDLLPQKLIPVIIELSMIEPDTKVNQINKKQRERLLNLIKNFEINISELMPLDMAIITCGGVDVKQINPKTMSSKLIDGLFFAGEVLDIDAYTGGFNLQIAFSTAYTAGKNNN
ncbi:MAG: NAD(P)/FAD-dependent oxidoreductase [Clostridia bacterium]